jgi:HD superfamily phosphodiesterase
MKKQQEKANEIELKHEYFDYDSRLHGYSHTKRVMILVEELGKHLPYKRKVKLAYYAAFIHDMARKHDGYCEEHGINAAKNKLPLFKDLFIKNGITESELEEIEFAVSMHSISGELEKANPFYIITAILKDADALDRVRLGDLDPSYFRFKETKSLIRFAEELFKKTII